MRMTVSTDAPSARTSKSLGRRIAGIALMVIGGGLGLFIVLFGILPHPPFMATPLPFVAALMFALAALGVWLVAAPPARVREAARTAARLEKAAAVTFDADGPRPMSKRVVQLIGVPVMFLATPPLMFGILFVMPAFDNAHGFGWTLLGISAVLFGSFWFFLR